MPEKKTETSNAETKVGTEGTAKKAQSAGKKQLKYGVKDFAAASRKLFGVMPECAEAALRLAGVKEATEEEAEKIVREFLAREIQ